MNAPHSVFVLVRHIDESGIWHSRLLCAKTREAPLKGSTIPRQELNGALLMAELARKVDSSWVVEIELCKLWTDSTIVLGWLNSQTNSLKTYVVNRVSQILDLTDASQWNHVRSEENPADVISTGIKAAKLSEASAWWFGPRWLVDVKEKWPKPLAITTDDVPEMRKIKLVLPVICNADNDLLNKYSSWTSLVRITAWLLRFSFNVRKVKINKYSKRIGHLTVEELQAAEMVRIRFAQSQAFSREITELSNQQVVYRKSRLRTLNPFLDNNGLIHVGGRPSNSTGTFSQKHPLLLPVGHFITRLIVRSEHERYLQSGPQSLLANIHNHYWPSWT